MMDMSDVRDAVSRIVYKPGWSFTVTWTSNDGTSYGEDRPGMMDVMIAQTVLDSSQPPLYTATLPYPFDEIVTIKTNNVDSEMDLYRMLLERAIDMERRGLYHEGREFFRVATGTAEWEAPFHPHRLYHENWNATAHRQLEENKSLPTG
jgi:hypothetical protein